jgi:plasmid stabilization system protein ParE
MARIVITDLADADTAKILEHIAREAGHRVASKYNAHIEALYQRLADHPESCHRHVRGEDTVSVIRIIDGRRKITRKLLQGDA